MKRERFIYLIVIVLIFSLVTACGDDDPSASSGQADDDADDDTQADDDAADDDASDDDSADDDMTDDDTTDDDDFDPLDPSEWAWRLRQVDGPGPNVMAAMAYDSVRQQAVLFGGGMGIPANSTWLWDGENWRETNTATKPPGLLGAVMAYDAGRDRIVLFGGASLIPYGHQQNTWEFDGVDWTRINPATVPEERSEASIAYNADREVIVMFGGCNGDQCYHDLNDTWEYDGNDWTQIETAYQPTPRSGAIMFYCPVRRMVLLFSGTAYNVGKWPQDMYEYDGVDWTPLEPATIPPGRHAAAHACDEMHGWCVMFGGYSGLDYLGDTWMWGGDDWQELVPFAGTIGPRTQMPMVYHRAAGHFVLFGGFAETGLLPKFYDETWVFAPEG